MGHEQFSFINKTLANLMEQSSCTHHYYSKDRKGKYVDCNDIQAFNLGLSVDEFIGLNDFDIAPFEYASQYRNNDLKVMKNESPLLLIERGIISNKHRISISHKMPILSHTKKIIGTTGVSILFDNEEPFNNTINIQEKYNYQDNKALTNREMECLYHLIKGKTAKQIASSLFISHRTVEQHFENCKYKLQCKNKQDLIEKSLKISAIRNRILRDLLI